MGSRFLGAGREGAAGRRFGALGGGAGAAPSPAVQAAALPPSWRCAGTAPYPHQRWRSRRPLPRAAPRVTALRRKWRRSNRERRKRPARGARRCERWRRPPPAPCASRASEERPGWPGPGQSGGAAAGARRPPRLWFNRRSASLSFPSSYAVSRKIEPFYKGGRVQVLRQRGAGLE